MNKELEKLIDEIAKMFRLNEAGKKLLYQSMKTSYSHGKEAGIKEAYREINENA